MEIPPAQIVQTRHSLTLPWEEVWIMPISDVQCGVEACDEERFRRHIKWGLEHGAYFIGGGDYVDMSNPSDRKRVRLADLNDTTTLALTEKAERDIELFKKLADGSQGRWLGFLQGHHYMEFGDGTTSDTRIAEWAGAPFLGDSCLVDVVLQDKKRHLESTCTIFYRHGQGSSATEAAALNKLYKETATWDADIYLHGHDHKKVATKKPRGSRVTGELHVRNTILAVTGSFMRGHMQGSRAGGRAGGTYVEKAGLPLVTLGGILLKLRPTKKGLDIDVEL